MIYEVTVADNEHEVLETYLIDGTNLGRIQRAAIQKIKLDYPSAARHHFVVTDLHLSRWQDDIIYA